MSTVVVVGAGGFIGSALAARLERDGVRVLRVLRGAPLPACREARCVHLADNNDPARAAADEAGARSESAELAGRILAAGYARTVLASTAYVYEASGSPRREDSPAAPGSAYARIKSALEASFTGPGRAIARLSNVYGPGQPAQNVFSDVLRQLPGDGVVRLRGSADSVRDYLFVEDAADGLARLALSDEQGVFNLSTGEGTSIQTIVETLARLQGLPRPRVESAAASSPSVLTLDPSLALARLGWKARTTLEEGLKTLVPAARSA